MYIVYVLLSALCLGFYEVLKKISLRKSSVYETLFFYCLCGFLCSLIFTNINFFDVSGRGILILLLKSGILVINWLLVLVANKKLDVGIVSAFSLLRSVFILFESALFFSEKITWVHIASLIIMGIGIILTTLLSNKERKESKKNHYIYIGILVVAALLGSFSASLDKYIISIENINRSTALSWYLMFNTVIYGVVYFIKDKKIDFSKLKTNYFLPLTGLGICLADTFYFLALSQADAQLSMVSILRRLSIIIATILASLFLKEKDLLKKLGILALMLVGVALPIIF